MTANNWNATFGTWSRPLSNTEGEKAKRAERLVKDAINAYQELSPWSISVFAQGSYRNGTNVKEDSDVDVTVCCQDLFITHYAFVPGLTDAMTGVTRKPYSQQMFKNEVGRALVNFFGGASVTRGNKIFTVCENTARLTADVSATFGLRVYSVDQKGAIFYTPGTHLLTDRMESLWNFPQQHFEKGQARNGQTALEFKRVVRVVKRLRNQMEEAGIQEAKPIASYLLESLVYNAPNYSFGLPTYYDRVREVVAFLYEGLGPGKSGARWLEVNELKMLFHRGQTWTMDQARAFLYAAWQYVGF